MFGKISRLLGGQEREQQGSKKREEGGGWDATSSKKVRVDLTDKPNSRGDIAENIKDGAAV